ncbi:hypothetical protein J5N97_006918 [Dioscorea zingiberensis]|uniref:Mucin-like protein n=1 Tax=Dioscorea zingiberensis TaxID=325984 RepID=A0A9D5HUG7_9LILI|nr:hypothetical protein J5N97_006918 [Dioscorea zingiberensis]
MHTLRRLLPFSLRTPRHRLLSTRRPSTGEDEWNDAWETAWLPDDLSAKSPRAPWESDVHFPSPTTVLPSDVDPDTKAFVTEMDERWEERRAAKKQSQPQPQTQPAVGGDRKDVDEYRMKKQRIHAGLWMKAIERMDELKLGDSGAGDDIDRLLDSCSEIFDYGNLELNDAKIPGNPELKTKPDGWETTTKGQEGNIWDITQREEDILIQEFERRIAFSKFQIASFIKTHIFSRRRPIDGWKYMIEELGPNARKGKGSVQRMVSLADPSTQPYKEERPAIAPNLASYRGR